jgi:hypothetical protein
MKKGQDGIQPCSPVTTVDGSIIAATIIGITAHTWTAGATGLYTTLADLGAGWKGFYSAMQAGKAGSLTAIQRLEGNAEAVIGNTATIKLTASSLAPFGTETDGTPCLYVGGIR